jgi:hypothetical protein
MSTKATRARRAQRTTAVVAQVTAVVVGRRSVRPRRDATAGAGANSNSVAERPREMAPGLSSLRQGTWSLTSRQKASAARATRKRAIEQVCRTGMESSSEDPPISLVG